jgi:sugar phosphate permease
MLRLQIRAFSLTWLGYATYYLTRKNFSVVKSRLHETLGVSTMALASIDTLNLAMYAAGQFVCGVLGDRFGARKLLTVGMLGTALASVAFGSSSSAFLFALAFGLNGFFQASGWSGNLKAVQPFFSSSSRGRVMGLWTTNYQVGGLVSTILATFVLTHLGWRMAFFVPAAWVTVVAVMLALFLVEKPEQRGLPPVEPDAATLVHRDTTAQPSNPSLFLLLRQPVLWSLGVSYFGLKLIRYSLLYWLPFYLRQQLHYTEAQAGYLSLPFEVGGVLGSVAIGWFSDRFFRDKRLRVTVPALLLLGVALLLFQGFGHRGFLLNAGLLACVGFLLFGPDSLLSGTMSQELGGRAATGRVAGLINGMGSIGAVFGSPLLAFVSKHYGWRVLFLGFFGLTVVSACTLTLSIRLLRK